MIGRTSGIWDQLRPVAALGLICCFAELAYAVVNVLAVPAYVSKGLGLGPMVGVVMSAFLLSEALGRPPMGHLSDIVGRKALIVAGPLVSAAAAVSLTLTGSPLLLVLIRTLDGVGAAAFWPCIFAAVGDRTSVEHRGEGMGLLNVSYMVGLALGPLAGGWVNTAAGTPGHPVYGAAFYLAAGLFGVASLLALLFVRGGRPAHQAEELVDARFSLRDIARESARVWRLLVIAFTTFMGIGILIPVAELYALDKYGISQKTFGTLFIVPAIAVALAAVPLGRMADRWGRLTSVRLGIALCALGLWLVPSISSVYIIAGGSIVVGVGFLLSFPAWMALLSDVTSETSRGSVLGAAGMAQGCGAIVGALAGGKIYHLGHPLLGISSMEFPMLLSASLLTVALVLTFALALADNRMSWTTG